METIKLPNVTDADNATLATLLQQLSEHTRRNADRVRYYEGKKFAENLTDVIPPIYRNIGLVLGWSGKAVDLLARRCNLAAVAWEKDLTDAGWATIEAGNAFNSEIAGAVTESLIHGVSFLIVDGATAAEQADGAPAALLHTVNALDGTGQWNRRTRRLDNFLTITGRDRQKITGLNLHLPNRIVTAKRDHTTKGGWDVQENHHSYGVPVEPMVYRPRVGKPFGTSRISRAMMAHQDQGLRELIRLEGHMDVFSFPQLWLLGADPTAFEDMNWQHQLAAGFAIPDAEDADPSLARVRVEQIQASSPEPHLAALNAAAQLFAREAALPDSALSITDYANPTSAEAYDSSQYELIHEAEGATEGWNGAVARSAARLLAIANNKPVADYSGIMPQWRNPRYLTRSAQADAGVKQLAAVPWLAETEIGLELLGLTPQQIRRAKAEQRRTRLATFANTLKQYQNDAK